MAVKVSHDDPVFCGGLNEVESDGLIRGGVDVENLQVVVWQDKFYDHDSDDDNAAADDDNDNKSINNNDSGGDSSSSNNTSRGSIKNNANSKYND